MLRWSMGSVGAPGVMRSLGTEKTPDCWTGEAAPRKGDCAMMEGNGPPCVSGENRFVNWRAESRERAERSSPHLP